MGSSDGRKCDRSSRFPRFRAGAWTFRWIENLEKRDSLGYSSFRILDGYGRRIAVEVFSPETDFLSEIGSITFGSQESKVSSFPRECEPDILASCDLLLSTAPDIRRLKLRNV